jgi:predicted phage terminase large subunit-like protein
VHSWDTANKASELSDFSVCTSWGIAGRNLYLLGVLRRRMDYPELKRAVVAEYARLKPDVVLIEDRASGTQLIQELLALGLYAVTRYRPQGDKVMRMHAQTATIESGFVTCRRRRRGLPSICTSLRSSPMAASTTRSTPRRSFSTGANHPRARTASTPITGCGTRSGAAARVPRGGKPARLRSESRRQPHQDAALPRTSGADRQQGASPSRRPDGRFAGECLRGTSAGNDQPVRPREADEVTNRPSTPAGNAPAAARHSRHRDADDTPAAVARDRSAAPAGSFAPIPAVGRTAMELQRLDPRETFLAMRCSSGCQEAVIRTRLVDMPTLVHLNSLSSPFASFRSAVSKPSVNQP